MSQFAAELCATAAAISTPGKGILAADESTGTIGKRFAPIGVENTEDNRRKYRQLLVNCPGLGEHISGCIMYEETLFQKVIGLLLQFTGCGLLFEGGFIVVLHGLPTCGFASASRFNCSLLFRL